MAINKLFCEFGELERLRGLLVFPHAQRTGGTSLRSLITQALGINNTYAQRTVDNFQHWKNLTEDDLTNYSAYLGHADFDGRVFTERQLFPIITIRAPSERLYSLYFYCQAKNGHPLQQIALESSPVDFLVRALELKPDYLRDTQCLRVCGKKDSAVAIRFLENIYLGYSTTLDLSLFSREIIDYFNWQVSPLEQKPTKSTEDEVPSVFRELAIENNGQDQLLYDFALRAN